MKKLWLTCGMIGVGIFGCVMFCAVVLGITSPIFAVFAYPAYWMLDVLSIRDSQPWIWYVLVFGAIYNFALGAAVGWVVQAIFGQEKK